MVPIYHSLLYIDRGENTHINMNPGDDPIDVYVSCASLLASSFRYHAATFRLLTNNRALIETRLAALGLPSFEIVELPFRLNVPKGLPFHSAHYKLEVYSHFASGELGDSLALVDLDAVMISPPPPTGDLRGKLLAYDITGQMLPLYGGEANMRADIELIGGRPGATLYWPGGEFFLGSPASFNALSLAISAVWPGYTKQFPNLRHTSDEMLLAAAATQCSGILFEDAASSRYIARWWSVRTDHRQVPLAAVKNCSILHLPADKHFLASQARIPFEPSKFVTAYEKATSGKLRLRRAANVLETLTGRSKKHVASLR